VKHDRPEHQRLRTIPLFASCTPAELDVIAQNVTEHRFTAGDVLMQEGDRGREFFVIVEGTVTVHLDDRSLSRIGPGGFVGEMALLDRHPRSATVIAETDLVVLVSGPREFSACLEAAPHLTRRLLSGVADRLRAADEELATR
jgi:CRP-like cAMP-binding protein